MALRPAKGVAWQTIDGEAEIADEVARRFAVSAEEARADVAGFLSVLRERGLVVEE